MIIGDSTWPYVWHRQGPKTSTASLSFSGATGEATSRKVLSDE